MWDFLYLCGALEKSMKEYRFRISGVHYAANPEAETLGLPDTEEMHVRTREFLRKIDRERPLVSLFAEPSNLFNPDCIMAFSKGNRIGRVADECVSEVKSLLAQSEDPILFAHIEDLTIMRGAEFIRQMKEITNHPSFYPIKDETGIYITGGEKGEDYDNHLNAARKAVEHGYRVFILPNPKGFRTADYIFERKGVFKLFDLKTILGKASAGTRLKESIGQTNHVILNLATNYDPRMLAKDVRDYFEANKQAREVLIMKGNRQLSVSRRFVEGKDYIKMFIKRFLK